VGPLERLGRIIEMGQRVAKDTTHQQEGHYGQVTYKIMVEQK